MSGWPGWSSKGALRLQPRKQLLEIVRRRVEAFDHLDLDVGIAHGLRLQFLGEGVTRVLPPRSSKLTVVIPSGTGVPGASPLAWLTVSTHIAGMASTESVAT